MGRLVDIQTAVKSLNKNQKKCKNIFKTILGVAEPFLATYFSKSRKDNRVKFLHNLHSSVEFVLSKFGIDIFDSFETMRFSTTYQFRLFSAVFSS